MNQLYFGDNLDVLRRHVKDESVDLIYLDPPFNSNATYNVLFGNREGAPSEAQAEAFRDTWRWGEAAAIAYDDVLKSGGELSLLLQAMRAWMGDAPMMAYLAMMAARLSELRRVLKPSGSLFLHCDPSAGHYLKVVLDAIFGAQNFRNEIVWRRSASHNKLSRQFGPIHDNILFYSGSDKITFHPERTPYTKEYIAKMFRSSDEFGPYRSNELTGSGTRTGDSGKPWRGYDPTAKGRHWAVPASLRKNLKNGGKGMNQRQMLEAIAVDGNVMFSPSGRPTYKQRMGAGVPYQDIWSYQPGTRGALQGTESGIDEDVKWLDDDKERMGYPTQKPVGLLERVVLSASDEGQTILDPFCGCGTTIEASEKLKRNWIGIDVTHYAVTLIENWLKRYPNAQFNVMGRPADLEGAHDLARRDKYQFQWWAAWLLGAQTYESKKGADRGIDANIFFANGPYGFGRIIISVKGGENVSPIWVRELAGVVDREKAEMGILVVLNEPTRAMKSDAIGCGFVSKTAHGRLPKIQIATIAELLDKRFPKLPPLPTPLSASPRTKAAKNRDQFELLLPFKTTTVTTEDGMYVDPRWIKSA